MSSLRKTCFSITSTANTYLTTTGSDRCDFVVLAFFALDMHASETQILRIFSLVVEWEFFWPLEVLAEVFSVGLIMLIMPSTPNRVSVEARCSESYI